MTSKDLGLVTAYAYAVSQGYTGTEEEFAELMASYATVAEEAAESAAEAAASATAAGASETNAASSAESANQSATSAGNSATSASGSAVQAQASATAAGQSATQAAGSATAAGNSATAAAGSATQAAASETAAGASATAAAGSATSASGSATAAAGSATEADASADRAQEILDSIPEDYTEMSEDVADLKSAIALLDNASVQSGWTSGAYYALGSSVTTVDIASPTTTGASSFICIAVPCKEGDVFYLTATGSSSARPYAFLSSASGADNIILRASSAEYVLANAKLTAPRGAIYAVFNASKNYDSYLLKAEANKTMLLTDVSIPFEIGNITLGSAPVYKYDRATRARTPEGYTIALHRGDVIGMTDYTDAQFYTGWYNSQGVFQYIPARADDYIVTEDGNYIFLLRNRTEVSLLGNITALTNLFFVRINTDANQIYTESVKTSKRAISGEASGLHSHLFSHASPKMAMHRGYSTLAPENTIPAFTLAGQSRAWAIETDVYETTDSHFVCIHDNDVSRMTDGTGNVTEMTFSQVETLTIDAGAHIEEYPNLKIPEIDDCLAICRRYGCICLIEIKTITNFDKLIAKIKKAGMENSVVFSTSSYANVPVYRYYTNAPIALIGYSDSDNTALINRVATITNTGVSFENSTVSLSVVQTAHENNMFVLVWTTDITSRAEELFMLGVDAVTSNAIPVLDAE